MLYSTIDASSSVATRIAAANAANSASNLKDFVGTPLQIVDVIQTPASFTNDDGKEINCVQTVLVDAEGVAYRTYFGGVARSVENIVAAFPDMNKPYGVTLTLREVPSQSGMGVRRYLEVSA